MIELKSYIAQTDQGPYLQINEDDHLVDPDAGLFMVLDGFGGTGVGDKYTELAREALNKFYTRIGDDPDSTMPFFYSEKYLLEGNALVNAMHHAHRIIRGNNNDKSVEQRGAVSALGMAQSENVVTFVSCGNSLVYLCRKGMIEQFISPDSLGALISERHVHNFMNCPMSALGLFRDIHLQVRELRVQSGDQILLMTEGAYSRLGPKEIKHIITDNQLLDQEKLDAIFLLANGRGNISNQTLVLMQF
jgi:PPM family protein phosphatase